MSVSETHILDAEVVHPVPGMCNDRTSIGLGAGLVMGLSSIGDQITLPALVLRLGKDVEVPVIGSAMDEFIRAARRLRNLAVDHAGPEAIR